MRSFLAIAFYIYEFSDSSSLRLFFHHLLSFEYHSGVSLADSTDVIHKPANGAQQDKSLWTQITFFTILRVLSLDDNTCLSGLRRPEDPLPSLLNPQCFSHSARQGCLSGFERAIIVARAGFYLNSLEFWEWASCKITLGMRHICVETPLRWCFVCRENISKDWLIPSAP